MLLLDSLRRSPWLRRQCLHHVRSHHSPHHSAHMGWAQPRPTRGHIFHTRHRPIFANLSSVCPAPPNGPTPDGCALLYGLSAGGRSYGDFLESGQYMKQRGRFCTDDVPEGELGYLAEAEGRSFEFVVPNAEEENLAPILGVVGPLFEAPPSTTVRAAWSTAAQNISVYFSAAHRSSEHFRAFQRSSPQFTTFACISAQLTAV